MTFIKTVPPRHATGETKEVYEYAAGVTGSRMTAKIVQMFSLRPHSMRRMVRNWELGMWMGPEPRAMRELAASAVSRFNDCHY